MSLIPPDDMDFVPESPLCNSVEFFPPPSGVVDFVPDSVVFVPDPLDDMDFDPYPSDCVEFVPDLP